MENIRLHATEDRVILRELHEAGGKINLYDLHKRYQLSPGQVFSACHKLAAMGLAARNGLTLEETPLGFELCVTSASSLWPQLEVLDWKAVPQKIRQRSEAGSALYCPAHMARK